MTLTNKDYHFVFFYLVSFLFLFIWQVLMVRKTDTILMVNLVNWKRSTIAVMILILILMTILATTLPFTWSTADGKKSPKSQTQFPHLSDFSTLFIPSLCFASSGKLFGTPVTVSVNPTSVERKTTAKENISQIHLFPSNIHIWCGFSSVFWSKLRIWNGLKHHQHHRHHQFRTRL